MATYGSLGVAVIVCKRAVALLSTALAVLALCGSHALGAVQSDPAKRVGSTSRVAVLDPSFGGSGLITLPTEVAGWTAYGAAIQNGGVIVSGGPTLQLLSRSGGHSESFGGAGTISLPAPKGGDFSLADFTLDSEGRLLVVGTSRFPGTKAKSRTARMEPPCRSCLRRFGSSDSCLMGV